MSYDANYTPFEPQEIIEEQTSEFINKLNDNFEKYSEITTETLESDIFGLDSELHPIAKTGLISQLTEDPSHQTINNPEKEFWDNNTVDGFTITNWSQPALETEFLQKHIIINNHFDGDKIVALLYDDEEPANPTTFTKFLPAIGRVVGTYKFSWNGVAWILNNNQVILRDYGIKLEMNGQFLVDGDYFEVTYTNQENIIKTVDHDILGVPVKTSQIINDGDGSEGDFYLTQRDIFIIEETEDKKIIVSSYETNVGDDSDSFSYKAIVELNDYIYVDGGDKNNCIYKSELDNINDYTTIISFKQNDADGLNGIVGKVTQTKVSGDRATLEFSISFIGMNTIEINSIMFVKQKENEFPEEFANVSYLASDGNMQIVDTDESGNSIVEMIVMITDNTQNQTLLSVGNYNIGIVDNCWAVTSNTGTVTKGSSATSSKIYYIRVYIGSTTKLYVNGNLEIDGASSGTLSGTIKLYADSSRSSFMKLYQCKIYNDDGSELLRDLTPACRKLDTKPSWYDYVNEEALFGTGADLIIGIESNLKDFIISGHGAPNTYTTRGVVGQFYKDLDTGAYYLCKNVMRNRTYIWEKSLLSYWYREVN